MHGDLEKRVPLFNVLANGYEMAFWLVPLTLVILAAGETQRRC
jgi:hypothetical protein